ncbi:MAG: ABC transporter ATP-binding protein [Desulfobacterales bacterium]|nr:MAG: ABC transporter ATP-binding protein [Desulfobacterales bacterium]
MAPGIRLSNIRYRYPGTGWVLDGIDLSVKKGEYAVVFGANGSGKSTIGYLLNGLVPHFFGGTLEGNVSVNGVDTRDARVCELFHHVGLVLQNAEAQLFNSTVENEIAFGLESLGLPAADIQKRIGAVADMLQLDPILAQAPHTLSGGEKRLAAIASVMCLDPSVLLLDEPFGDLDWKSVQRVGRLLQQIHGSGKTVIVIEQRLGSYVQHCTRSVITAQGKILFDGNRQDAQRVLKEEHLVPNYPIRSQRIRRPGNDSILQIQGLSFNMGARRILSDVTLDFRRGETVAIVGENGSGKTTLIKHFNGLLRPTVGDVMINGHTIRDKSPAHLAQLVGICFQNPNDQFFKYAVKDEILTGPKTLKLNNAQWLQKVCSVLELNDFFDRSPYKLSEGEKKRVAIASIMAMQPEILILDEPTVGQDGRFKEALASLLGVFEDMGVSIIVVTHDLEFAQAVADRWIVLHTGRVVADGSPNLLRHDQQLIRMGALDRPGEYETAYHQP